MPAAQQYAPGPLLGIRRFSPTIYFLVCNVPRGMFFLTLFIPLCK